VEPFENALFWKWRLLQSVLKKVSYIVISSSIFRHFSVDDRQKHIKRYAFSYKNVIVWTGENPNPSVGENI